MIGIVVVSHSNISNEMISATSRIVPEATHMSAVAVESNDPPESIRQHISEAVQNVDQGNGVLILTDMFGGTPSNICMTFLQPEKIEVVSGFNMPMLIKLANLESDADFMETVHFIQKYGQRNIVIASEVLAGKERRYEHG
ncbi:MAG: PTS sugar transporter subunit IIA [Pseudomonadota bacterium]